VERDILGAKQHGVINVVGVSHFIRMLNKAVEDLKAGRVLREEEPEEVSVEIPIRLSFLINSLPIPKKKLLFTRDFLGRTSVEYWLKLKRILKMKWSVAGGSIEFIESN
jgi:transcription-repair coupling factor (superfamily II helicase)